MIKYILILFFILGCKSKAIKNCNKPIEDTTVCFVIHGQFYGNKPVQISLQKFVDKQDWMKNLFFTGKGFSATKENELLLDEGDSCILKQIYFDYIEKLK